MLHANPLVLILIVIIVVALLPTWPYSHNWGYAPVGGLGGLLILILILILLGVL